MQPDRRRELRAASSRSFSISWQDGDGLTHSATVRTLNSSYSGVAFRTQMELAVGTAVYIEAREGFTTGYSVVRHCSRQGDGYVVGLQLDEATKESGAKAGAETLNYYEFLQISPNAQIGTIHRIYRYLAAYYHPDNPETADPEKFVLLNRAYKTLSDPERRAAYDAELRRSRKQPNPEFAGIDFVDGVEGELNRRLAVLAVLYKRCRANVNDPRVSLLDLEAQMGFPREYLDFTTWYLKCKKYIRREDNSDFSLTAEGVDFVEENCDNFPLLHKLLNAGAPIGSHKEPETGDTKAGLRPAQMLIPPSDCEFDDSEPGARRKGYSNGNGTL